MNYLERTNNDDIRFWINTTLKNYLVKNEENIGEIEHILDYMEAKHHLKNVRGMSYKDAKSNAEKWVKAMNKKGRGIVESDEDTEIVTYLDNGFTLRKLVNENAYKREGALMAHCVSSYSNRNTNVYSLRDKDNNPHATFEITKEKDKVSQIKGKGNGSVHPKYIQYVIEVLNYFELPIKSSEMTYLGYTQIDDSFLDIISINYTNAGKFVLEFDNNIYFYTNAVKEGLKAA